MKEGQYILFSCNTYMQLLTAIRIRCTMFEDAKADILLSDHSVNAQDVGERLRGTGIFDRIRVVQSKFIIYSQSKLEDVKDVLALTFETGGRYERLLWDDCLYDMVLYYNQNDLCALYAYEKSRRMKSQVKACCFEEGILSYSVMSKPNPGGRMKAIMWLRRLLRKQNMLEETAEYFCYYPDLFPNGRVIPVPRLKCDDMAFLSMINTVFAYHPDHETYPQRYIFFASSSDIDGTPVGETELVLQIAELVGRENLLVKMHPRDDRDVYEKQGITVSRNSAIPWEVIQLNQDFSNHVFLTVSSGSVVNASAMLGDKVPTFFLYPLVKGRNTSIDSYCENTIQPTLDKLKQIGALQSVKTAYDLQDIVI